MWIISLFLAAVFLGGMFTGNLSNFSIDKLTKQLVLNTGLLVLTLFAILLLLYNIGYFPQWIAAPFMMAVYSFTGGFLAGFSFKQYQTKKKAGDILYQHRSFWVDHAPSLLAIALILFGIYRTAILTELDITGIRVTSGLSLICFGVFTWTLKAVPEFRKYGIILFDRLIKWEDVISWHWYSEEIIAIEYITGNDENEVIREFLTSVPMEDKKEIERILASKADDYYEVRKKRLLKED
jgi:uncharacterized membrane protein YiaA